MSTSIFILLVVQIILIILNAIFASAEIAVLSMNETKLERMAEQGNGRAKRLVRLTQEPARFLATIQVAITLSGFLGSAFAADNFSEPLVDWVIGMGVNIPRSTLDTIAVILITLILSYFTLVFGELVPKRIAMKKSEELAMGISGLVTGISILFKPIVSFLSLSTNIVLKICGIDPNEAEDQVGEEEIRMLVDSGSEKGTIDHQEKEFIQNVFEFNDIMAGTIATRRTDVTILYTGAGNITAIGFANAMFQMSQSMFIFNVILSAIIGRSLASEIENKSIRLYINRVGVRKLIYLGKELSLLLFSIFIDILLVLTSIIFYYAVLIHNPKVASGILYDSNAGMEIAQIICNCMFWLITIYLVMLIATKLKTLVCVGTYMILYIIMNLMSYMDGIKYLSPLHYIVAVSSNTLQFTFSTMIFSLYTICMGILFTHIGIRRIEKMDL